MNAAFADFVFQIRECLFAKVLLNVCMSLFFLLLLLLSLRILRDTIIFLKLTYFSRKNRVLSRYIIFSFFFCGKIIVF